MKLFATKIVASNFFGFFNNLLITANLEGLVCDKSFKSFGVSENKATSAAATIAQQKSKKKIPIIPKSKSVSKVDKNPKLGSGSKF